MTIIGAGGIGCAIGHALRLGGVDVTMIETDPTKLEWGRAHGIGLDEEVPQPAVFVPFDEWSGPAGEIMLLTTKCYDNRAVLDRVASPATLIPVQNGYDKILAERVEVEGIASFVSECLPGRTHTRITRPGELHIGCSTTVSPSGLDQRVERLIEVLDRFARFEVRSVDAVLPFKNTKLMYNSAISPIAAMAGLDNGQLLTIPRARVPFFGLIRENYRILTASGSPLARIGPFHPDTVDRILRLPMLARLMAIPFARTLRGTYCSMAGDLPDGPTELENYNGHLLDLAGDLDVPLNRTVHALFSEIEADGQRPSLSWLDELLARIG